MRDMFSRHVSRDWRQDGLLRTKSTPKMSHGRWDLYAGGPELSPLHHGHALGRGRSRVDDGNDDVLVRNVAPYLHDSCPGGDEEVREEDRASQTVRAPPHS